MNKKELEKFIGNLYRNPRLDGVLFALIYTDSHWYSSSHFATIVRGQDQYFSSRDLLLPAGIAFEEESLVLGSMESKAYHLNIHLGYPVGSIPQKYLPFIRAAVYPSSHRIVIPKISDNETTYSVTVAPGKTIWRRNT